MHQRRLPIASPCPQSLDGMPRRSEVERWCTVCEKSVHELSAMRESEARALLRASSNRRICVGYQVDAAGQVLFRDRPPRTGGRTALALAGLALAVTLAASGCVGFEYEEVTTPDVFAREYWAESSYIPVSVAEPSEPSEPVAEFGQLVVVVVDSSKDEQPIAEASVEVSSEADEFVGPTSAEGIRQFGGLEPGHYAVEVVAGFAESEVWIRVEAGAQSMVTFRIDPRLHPEPEDPLGLRMQGDVELDQLE